MHNRIDITTCVMKSNELHLKADPIETEIEQLEDTKQMLVDSDNMSFVYVVDINDQFMYVGLSDNIWANLKHVLHKDMKVFLEINKKIIELSAVKEELSYLISNIEGNVNYGDEMVARVEEVFLDKENK
ncbi:hypothetical protein H8R29_03735 [Priestia megaterium]|jgi:Family of unknown function (UPF0738)|uniref:Uncharacterized protein n=1 Tax=Priestia megaterium (strain ATCC 14581 / DSM 32 / CCUG 1817 / JCM 2506 / NBRC 15308 / NCIMB 9376 / NCTC 10342 / NRRL B-14308 / VKM B-512 / Ford 19) TaxID=1348623 RepID=A0A0B6A9B3_PRIM2|nr:MULTISPECIES: hypothetical protein [Priestia]MCJ7991887.1 hypothetical protein [Priestia sp. OVS21]AJI21515.1 hypothetical protein BG04_3018 [Priestia megaterium NBRC 15308 = ATCC 14581]KFM96765.1 hypothetical protein DJ91_2254 [Priestia megaterium]KGJ76354.1 hypothetical protein BMT_30110 [Priestia megaterium NBRC 15308 = ATCC 14581]KLV33247.1 hypothetical protein ABW04_04405 [Priestia megaterium]